MEKRGGARMKWISVKDKLPINESDEWKYYHVIDVIVSNGHDVFFTQFEAGRTIEYWSNFKKGGVTHWMPLPNPPEKKKTFDDALKEYIQRNPLEYNAKFHEHLFTEEELQDLSQSLRG